MCTDYILVLSILAFVRPLAKYRRTKFQTRPILFCMDYGYRSIQNPNIHCRQQIQLKVISLNLYASISLFYIVQGEPRTHVRYFPQSIRSDPIMYLWLIPSSSNFFILPVNLKHIFFSRIITVKTIKSPFIDGSIGENSTTIDNSPNNLRSMRQHQNTELCVHLQSSQG